MCHHYCVSRQRTKLLWTKSIKNTLRNIINCCYDRNLQVGYHIITFVEAVTSDALGFRQKSWERRA